ncbi:MAG TPA: hypothetical protein VHS99_18775 [Chloroflexota bacterium]|nr:hypothetical protein [Chloroflexota bacterium]
MDAQIGTRLLPRYQRPLTFGGVLDETFRIYRQWWSRLAGITALSVAPGFVAFVLFGGAAAIAAIGNAGALANADEGSAAGIIAGLGLGFAIVSILFIVGVILGEGATTALTGWVMRGDERSIRDAFTVGVRRFWAVLGFAVATMVAVFVLTLVAVPLFFVGIFGVLGTLVALVGLVMWINRGAGERPQWLKWMIILATPFGLPIYYGVRWSLALQAVVLEGTGPLEGMRRSSELVEGHWFKVFGVWLVVGIIVSILEGIPSALIVLLGTIAGFGTQEGMATALVVQLAANAAQFLGWVLFGAVTFVAATVLFVDLRNRREGADLVERLGDSGVYEPATGGAG